MTYTLLRGQYVIRYPDLPRQGPEPDGDTVKFRPDQPALVESLPRPSGTSPDISPRGISVRLEAVDALETHFADTHQELLGAYAAREELLASLGFTNVRFFDDLPNKVRSADQDTMPGYVLSNGIDANGRMIGFAYAVPAAGSAAAPSEPDGASVFLDAARVDVSVNARLLATGLAYPAYYATLPVELRTHLAGISTAARERRDGIFARATGDPDSPATVTDLAALERLVIWPKLFRRIVPYLAAGHDTFDQFDAWLRADPVRRDDRLFRLDTLETGNMHDVVEAHGQTIRLTLWPELFVIDPDPAPPGVPTGGQLPAAGDVLVLAALPDPAGPDAGAERVTILNTTAKAVDLTGWTLSDAAGGRTPLTGALGAGDVVQVVAGRAMPLGNQGDSVVLTDARGQVIDKVSYKATAVRPGRTISFGR